MSLDLKAIRGALADQVRENIGDDWNVRDHPRSGAEYPLIEVFPGDPYVEYHPDDVPYCEARVNLRLRIHMDGAEGETAFDRMDRALSSGSTHTSSVADAVIAIDPTLGGVVVECVILPAEYVPTDDAFVAIAEIPVTVLVDREP